MGENKEIKLPIKQKLFCQEYIIDWNGTRAYKSVYKGVKNDNVAGVQSFKLLRKAKIKEYIKEIQNNLEEQAGLSKLMVLKEHKKLAFSNFNNINNTWIEKIEFENLSGDVTACIETIETKIQKKNIGTSDVSEIVDVEFVKIKFYSKQKSLDAISELLSYNAPVKTDVTTNGESLNYSGLSDEELEEKIKKLSGKKG